MEGDLITRKDLENLQEALSKQLQVAEENNRLLLSMRKWGRVAFWFKVAIWAVVLIAPLLLFPYIAPLIPGSFATSSTASVGNNSLFGLPSPSELQEIFHK